LQEIHCWRSRRNSYGGYGHHRAPVASAPRRGRSDCAAQQQRWWRRDHRRKRPKLAHNGGLRTTVLSIATFTLGTWVKHYIGARWTVARLIFNFFNFFFVPLAILYSIFRCRCCYLEPCTRPYEIRIYRHSSVLRALTAGRFRPTRPTTVVGKACFITF
jgi:hypothetical protein